MSRWTAILSIIHPTSPPGRDSLLFFLSFFLFNASEQGLWTRPRARHTWFSTLLTGRATRASPRCSQGALRAAPTARARPPPIFSQRQRWGCQPPPPRQPPPLLAQPQRWGTRATTTAKHHTLLAARFPSDDAVAQAVNAPLQRHSSPRAGSIPSPSEPFWKDARRRRMPTHPAHTLRPPNTSRHRYQSAPPAQAPSPPAMAAPRPPPDTLAHPRNDLVTKAAGGAAPPRWRRFVDKHRF